MLNTVTNAHPFGVFFLFVWDLGLFDAGQDLTLELSLAWNVPFSCLHLWSLELQVQATYHI